MNGQAGLGKVAVITGGSSGIGQAVGLRLAQEGFHVVLVGTQLAKVSAATAQLPALPGDQPQPHHLGLALDVTQEADMAEMAARTLEVFGRIDVLVASAGVARKPGSDRVMPYPIASLPLDEWTAILDINLTGLFLSNRAVLPAMIQQGAGHILNVGSCTTLYGLRGEPYAPAYCASKFAALGFTESLAAEVSAQGIRAQVLLPGLVTTALTAQTGLAHRFQGRAMTAATAAAMVLYLITQPTDSVVVHPHLLPCPIVA
jgi:NAD(P)-dependent dehydrogenase (short-subunit alcohol dehydrogenase family)